MAEHRVCASWHVGGGRCPVPGVHTWVLCSCGWQQTADSADEIADLVRAHNRLAVWEDHRGRPLAGFGGRDGRAFA